MNKKRSMHTTYLETRDTQLHAGRYWSDVYDDWRAVYYTNSDGKYWTGYMPHDLSPEELFAIALSTLNDLMRNHPELNLYDYKTPKNS